MVISRLLGSTGVGWSGELLRAMSAMLAEFPAAWFYKCGVGGVCWLVWVDTVEPLNADTFGTQRKRLE